MRLLDLYCGAGGAGMGYHRAGWEVVGVDLEPQPNYPFEFVQGDALTKGTNAGRQYQQLIPATRALLGLLNVPTVIENVQGSDLRRDLTLCGEMFGLGVIRHRYFEVSVSVSHPPHMKHRGRVAGWRHGKRYDGPYVAVYGDGGGKGSLDEWRAAMGIDWMQTRHELAESIPPAYTEFVGGQLMAHLEQVAA